ncbi:MAG TPA: acyl-homoserine-lactone synthase [Sphingomicrobium sp.]|nr:acyl-homoserine-lactone synthase [Sphingomicrobium sp.]
MIIVANGRSWPAQGRALSSMFEARKQVFVDLLKWDVPVIGGRFELDQYDDDRAAYLIVANGDGEHLGSARLLETTRSHILADLYPELCEGPLPRGPRTFEITRFCLGRNQRATERRDTRNRLVSALVRFALDRGITRYTGVAEVGWLQQILAFGWDCSPLGAPRELGGRVLGALVIAITAETPTLLAQNGVWIADTPTLAEAA